MNVVLIIRLMLLRITKYVLNFVDFVKSFNLLLTLSVNSMADANIHIIWDY